MSKAIAVSGARAHAKVCDASTKVTRSLLGYGIIAGPIYVLVGLVEGLIRPGFDLTRHDLSLLSNGSLGWIHIGLFISTGLMTMAGAIGMARASSPLGSAWGPRLVGVYGLALVAAGVMVADPMDGFPIGTPAGRPAVTTWHGTGHLVAAAIGFICLTTACFMFARWFGRLGRRGWAVYSAISGGLFFSGFIAIAASSGQGASVLAFWAAVIIVSAWVSSVSLYLYRHVPTTDALHVALDVVTASAPA